MKYAYLLLVMAAAMACGRKKDAAATTIPSDPAAPPSVHNGAVQIDYTVNGTADTALVFVHGWCINKEYWATQDSAFSKRFKVVTIDLGGHGTSGRNRDRWAVEDYAQDIKAVLDALQLKKVILVGHSMSGNIILETATRLPQTVIGLVGIDNFKNVGAPFTPEQEKEIAGFMQIMSSRFDSTVTAFTSEELFPPNPDSIALKRVIKDFVNMDSVVAIKTLDSIIPDRRKEPNWFAAQLVPVHAIISDYTPTDEASVRKHCKKGFHVKYIAGTGHYPMIEKPQEFNRLLWETVNEIAAGK